MYCLALGGDRFGEIAPATLAILLAFVVILDFVVAVGIFAFAAFAICVAARLADFAFLLVDVATLMRITSAPL